MNKIYTDEILFPYGIIMCQKAYKKKNLPAFYQILIKKDNEWKYIINDDNEAQPRTKNECLELITKFKNNDLEQKKHFQQVTGGAILFQEPIKLINN